MRNAPSPPASLAPTVTSRCSLQQPVTEASMKRHRRTAHATDKRSGSGTRHAVIASAFLAAGLSCAVFVTLFRAPMPVDAFAALGQRIAVSGHGVAG
jgi:hypothetical protein